MEPCKEPRALTLLKPGVLELRPIERDLDAPLREGELLVQVEYSSVQPFDGDLFACEGRFKEWIFFPHVMGVEGAGVVLRSRSPDFPEGSRIAFLLRRFFDDDGHGCWQKHLLLDAKRALIVPVPVDVGLNQVAAAITSTVAALGLLRHFPAGSQIIVASACGAVGLAALQLGALRGFKMVGLVRGAERVAWLTQELADCGSVAVIDTSLPGWQKLGIPVCSSVSYGHHKTETVDMATDSGAGDLLGGADGFIDGVGGELLVEVAETLLRGRATIVRYGSIAGPVDEERLAAATRRLCLEVKQESVENFLQTSDVASQVQAAYGLIVPGKFRPKAWHVCSWKEAHECMKEQPVWTRHVTQRKPGRIGRIILRFD